MTRSLRVGVAVALLALAAPACEVTTTSTAPDGSTRGIGESVGAGTVQLVATLDAAASDPVDTRWRDDGCHVRPREERVTLVLR